MLHVVGVRTAVAPDISGDAARRADVVVAADRADVLLPRAHAHESRVLLIGQDLLGLVDIDDEVGPLRDRDAETLDRRRLPDDRLQRITRLDPPVIAAVEQSDVVNPGVPQDRDGPSCGDLSGPSAGPLFVGVALCVAAVHNDRRVVADSKGPQRRVEHLG